MCKAIGKIEGSAPGQAIGQLGLRGISVQPNQGSRLMTDRKAHALGVERQARTQPVDHTARRLKVVCPVVEQSVISRCDDVRDIRKTGRIVTGNGAGIGSEHQFQAPGCLVIHLRGPPRNVSLPSR